MLRTTRISRDCFARTELHARTVTPNAGQTCGWCGNLTPRGKLKQYETQTDGGRTFPIPGRFCSVGCMRTFHGA